MDQKKIRIAVFGASGYTGSELIRLLLRHPNAEIVALTAERRAGQAMADVFPQFYGFELPRLTTIEEVDWGVGIDLVFCALPHGTTQTVIRDTLAAHPHVRVIDLSADFRLADPAAYARWYGHEHRAVELQREAVYGLTEIHREKIRSARLVANPGCYTTTAILPVVPLIAADAIDTDEIIVDAASGMTGAGRAAKEGMLFSEVSEGFHAYGVGGHRHTAELDQEYALAAGRPVMPSFTPHLAPMNRGIYATIYVRGKAGRTAEDLHGILARRYAEEAFVSVLPFAAVPHSRHVRGSNRTLIGVVADRRPGHAIILSTLDNLVKGASGQAVQNMNVMFDLDETTGLAQIALFP